MAPEPLPAAAASVRSRPPWGPPGPADTWSGAHQEPLQRPAPAPSSGPESGSPGAGGRRRRRRHPPPPAPSSSASLLPPPPPPPRAPHGPPLMARGREAGAAPRTERALRGRARGRGPGARGRGPGPRAPRPQAPESHRAPARPPGVLSPEQQRRRLPLRPSGWLCGPGSTPTPQPPAPQRPPAPALPRPARARPPPPKPPCLPSPPALSQPPALGHPLRQPAPVPVPLRGATPTPRDWEDAGRPLAPLLYPPCLPAPDHARRGPSA